MATTEDVIVDRVRTILMQQLHFSEARGRDFSLTPLGATDKRFIVSYAGGLPVGGFAFREEAQGRLVIELVRPTNANSAEATRKLYQDAREVLTAIVHDAAVMSGEYAIDDADRALELSAPAGASYQVLRLTVGVNFEAVLA